MPRKTLAQGTVLILLALSFLGTPSAAMAGGVCGGTYIAEKGDTVDKLAAMCGTSASLIYAANPGISATLSVGQVLTIPGLNYSASVLPNSDPAYYYSNFSYSPSASNASTYIVQFGDTFASIANRYGISFDTLWGANPQIWDTNLLYVGQMVYIPAPFFIATQGAVVASPVSTAEPTTLIFPGDIPKNAPRGNVRLVNKANADVYVSLRITRANGTSAIYEYPVSGTRQVEIPAGWIDYVASVGGVKFTGGFQLKAGTYHTLTFNKSKVVVD